MNFVKRCCFTANFDGSLNAFFSVFINIKEIKKIAAPATIINGRVCCVTAPFPMLKKKSPHKGDDFTTSTIENLLTLKLNGHFGILKGCTTNSGVSNLFNGLVHEIPEIGDLLFVG